MVTKALYVRFQAKPGREGDVESFLRGGLPIVDQEPATTAWFAIRMGPSTFGIFDAFPDETGRQAHLAGDVAKALKEKASELFSEPPAIEKIDVLAAKLPG
ncbi:putative quinol monooxygenase [Devosia aurantiaca]|uniref:Antibiotic biosynthesis monooxygenase n=1 Tax=Devosia aurantiaca TaxID=2714858 RepID=A0A6M1SIU1_9HYPH|nr:antibiotic biosynthesis monooxygenase [Devosia aurantiaca]NGP17010.1 antibiotic biosynthesis monooxygenase [Devosia aurantiaca]